MTLIATAVYPDEEGPLVAVTDIVTLESLDAGSPLSGCRYQQDGSIDELFAESQSQIHPGEWFINEPQANIGNDYDIREASHVSGTWDFAGAAVGVWINIGTGRNWWVQRTGTKGGEGNGTDQAIGDFEIRDSATQTLQTSWRQDSSATLF